MKLLNASILAQKLPGIVWPPQWNSMIAGIHLVLCTVTSFLLLVVFISHQYQLSLVTYLFYLRIKAVKSTPACQGKWQLSEIDFKFALPHSSSPSSHPKLNNIFLFGLFHPLSGATAVKQNKLFHQGKVGNVRKSSRYHAVPRTRGKTCWVNITRQCFTTYGPRMENFHPQ